ncbi:hypothetical protein Sjap_025846 [Stephania japonica]|uniref:GDSL esterase/lipase n=1 Tax=Stephania japonica TaxID=461633 RepID=A0AAP0E2D7_9MAGN
MVFIKAVGAAALMMTMSMAILLGSTLAVAMPTSPAIGIVNIGRIRKLVAKYNLSSILVFGDSSADPGNNNHLATTFKGNFPPYGKDFFGGRPTGRFSNGRLPTDFVAEALGYAAVVPAFLDPNVKTESLSRAVSFASAASGYDDLTANLTNVLPVWKQLEYLKHYIIRMRRLMNGETKEMIKNAVFVLSMGANDFLQNYFVEPNRPKQFTVQQYEDYLVGCLIRDVKEMHRIGARRLVVVGVPPLGCMPLVKTAMNSAVCVDKYNIPALSLNIKIKNSLATLAGELGLTAVFADAYGAIVDAVNNPKKYGFVETSKGCCGTGTYEYGDTCKGQSTCKDPSKYVFWDAVHPTEKMYEIIAADLLNTVLTQILA